MPNVDLFLHCGWNDKGTYRCCRSFSAKGSSTSSGIVTSTLFPLSRLLNFFAAFLVLVSADAGIGASLIRSEYIWKPRTIRSSRRHHWQENQRDQGSWKRRGRMPSCSRSSGLGLSTQLQSFQLIGK